MNLWRSHRHTHWCYSFERILPLEFDHRWYDDGLRWGSRCETEEIHSTSIHVVFVVWRDGCIDSCWRNTRSISWTILLEEKVKGLVEFPLVFVQEFDRVISLTLRDGNEVGNHRFVSIGHHRGLGTGTCTSGENFEQTIEFEPTTTSDRLGDLWITNRKQERKRMGAKIQLLHPVEHRISTKVVSIVRISVNFLSDSMKYYICLSNKKRKLKWDKSWRRGHIGDCRTRRRMYKKKWKKKRKHIA